MNQKKLFKELLLPLAIGMICSIVSAILLYRYIQEIQESEENQSLQQVASSTKARIPVVVSSQPLNAGMMVSAEHLRVRELDEVSLPSDVIHPSEVETLVNQIIRSDLEIPIEAGKPLQWLHLQLDSSASFGNSLVPGKVPFSMPINALQQHAGLLQAGDVIDLYKNHHGYAELVLGQIEVLATGSVTAKEPQVHQQPGRSKRSYANDYGHNQPSGFTQRDYQQITLAVPLASYFMLLQLAERQNLWPILRNSADELQLSKLQGIAEVEFITPGQNNRLLDMQLRGLH